MDEWILFKRIALSGGNGSGWARGEKAVSKFRKKPVVIDAVLWNGDNIEEIRAFMHPAEPIYLPGFTNSDDIFGIQTLEGMHTAQKGDWIIKGVKGEFYPCKPDIFAVSYEPENTTPRADETQRDATQNEKENLQCKHMKNV